MTAALNRIHSLHSRRVDSTNRLVSTFLGFNTTVIIIIVVANYFVGSLIWNHHLHLEFISSFSIYSSKSLQPYDSRWSSCSSRSWNYLGITILIGWIYALILMDSTARRYAESLSIVRSARNEAIRVASTSKLMDCVDSNSSFFLHYFDLTTTIEKEFSGYFA